MSPAAYDEIATKLRAAGYDHAFDADEVTEGHPMISMQGIAVTREAEKTGEDKPS